MRQFVSLLLLVILPISAIATHIISSELTYTCLGNNQYKITIKRSYDCSQPFYSLPSSSSIFKYTGDSINLGYTNIPKIAEYNISPNTNFCSNPPSLCVKEGLYEGTIFLPFNPLGYYISWCTSSRNTGIINTPDQSVVISSYIPPTALTACNNSPTFNNQVPLVVCQNQAINIDHSATDIDGDSLVYKFCTPYGGCTLGAPPFTPMSFYAPFSGSAPLGGTLVIDPSTGLITGNAPILGLFVLSVCVEEYRNGQLIGKISREILLLVYPCLSTLQANIVADSIDNNTFYIKSCGNTSTSISFQNLSSVPPNFSNYLWQFNGNTITSNATNPTITFPGYGQYTGSLTLSPNTTCSDNINIVVDIYPPIVAGIAADSVSNTGTHFIRLCGDSTITFQNLSNLPSNIANYIWEFNVNGNTITSNATNPTITFPGYGQYTGSLTLSPNTPCSDNINIVVDIYPPIVASIAADSLSNTGTHFIRLCGDSTITFQNLSNLPSNIANYIWEFNVNGSKITSTATNPTITFPGDGQYTGSLIAALNTTTCRDTLSMIIDIFSSPIADFSYLYNPCTDTLINFQYNSSIGSQGSFITDWMWDFGDNTTAINITSPIKQYENAGVFEVQLTIMDSNGCSDTANQNISWFPSTDINPEFDAISGCIPLDVTFDNNFSDTTNSILWSFGDGTSSTAFAPIHTYQDTGLYTVIVSVLLGAGCTVTDTFVNLINLKNPPTSNFYYTYDSCEYSPVSFFSTSQEGDGQIIQWDWSLEGNNSVTTQGMTTDYQYTDIGTYNATLTVVDDNDCEVSLTQEVDWQPAPVFPVELPDFENCEPLTIEITDTTYPIEGYFTLWNYGDGYYSDNFNDIHTYENAGSFDMSLTVITKTGCFEEFIFPAKVTVNENPIADFLFSPNTENLPNVFAPTVAFTNNSLDATTLLWNFDNEETSTEENPIYNFQDTGLQIVTLEVSNAVGCSDTISQSIDVKPAFTYYLPNAFTPNDDGKNDGYRGVGELFGVTNFKLQIWNKWGELVFETSDPLESWNGRVRNTGEKVISGVYVVVATMTSPRGLPYEVKGFATVVN